MCMRDAKTAGSEEVLSRQAVGHITLTSLEHDFGAMNATRDGRAHQVATVLSNHAVQRSRGTA